MRLFAKLATTFVHSGEKPMHQNLRLGLCAAAALLFVSVGMSAEPQHGRSGSARPAVHGEPHAGPKGYQRPAEPAGWNARPATIDKPTYQHNYQAARSYKIGPYRRPPGWTARRWAYGQTLPRAYWTAQYIIGDYWLFGLEVAPAGCEWVRDDTDALLVNTSTGEILQVEYGVFA
jgi:Ni/Co efflux regulator RcnB